MKITAFPSGPFETNAYLIYCPKTLHAAIIDPAPGSKEALIEEIKKHSLLLKAYYLTHSHWDHFGDLKELSKLYPAPIWIHPLDAPNLVEPGADGLPMFQRIQAVEPTHFYEEGDQRQLGELAFEVLHTPGHSPGGVCLYFKLQNVLISGDTLFKGTMGNISFPTSNASHMWKSLEKLSKLPLKTQVYPGHGTSTTIGEEPWLSNAKKLFS